MKTLDTSTHKCIEYVLNVARDSVGFAIETITSPHYQVHTGNHFLYTDAVSLNDTATQNYLITTPNTTKWAHMIFALSGSAITQFELYEGTDKAGTTLQTIGNSNRNSTKTAGITIHKGISGGTIDGTLLHKYKGGSATNQSKALGATGNNDEIILKQNTKYILRTTSGSASCLTNVRIAWYELTSRLSTE